MALLTKQYLHDATVWSHYEVSVLTFLSKIALETCFKGFRKSHVSPVNSYLEGVGVAYAEITSWKRGRIKINGSLWFARSNSNMTILPGQKVRVTGRQSNTLLVELSRYS
ncbi:MAG: NfeD family protein [Cyanobacteria bacterium P01_B01_bin.77]